MSSLSKNFSVFLGGQRNGRCLCFGFLALGALSFDASSQISRLPSGPERSLPSHAGEIEWKVTPVGEGLDVERNADTTLKRQERYRVDIAPEGSKHLEGRVIEANKLPKKIQP